LIDFLIRSFILLPTVLLYYSVGSKRITDCSRSMVNYLPLTRRYSLSEVDNIVKLLLAGISQIAFCFVLIFIAHLDFRQLGLNKFQPILIVYGVLLGLGEMALGSFFCHLCMRIAMVVVPTSVPTELKDWLTLVKGGWMRELLNTAEIVPSPLAFLFIILYISGEEIIFRGVLLNFFLPVGAAFALGASVFLFATVQTLHMPSWRSAMFPIIGALLVGFVHGALFLVVPNILPLIVAHFVFFISAVIL
jgi:membrane protease YdiL (CAAX protease family)